MIIIILLGLSMSGKIEQAIFMSRIYNCLFVYYKKIIKKYITNKFTLKN